MLSTCFKGSIRILRPRFNATFSQKLRSCARFPYQEENVGKWFTKESPLPQDPSHVRTINILNLTKNCSNADTFSKALKGDGFKVLFHGTNQKAAKDIIENGVRLDKLLSNIQQDFSCGRGFYLTENFERKVRGAKYYADKSSHAKKAAILIFKIPNDVIEKYRANAKIFNDNKELIAFVEKFRDVNVSKRTLEKILENVSYVEGRQVTKKDKRVVEGSHQICILSEELSKCLDRYLDSAIFFNLNRNSSKRLLYGIIIIMFCIILFYPDLFFIF